MIKKISELDPIRVVLSNHTSPEELTNEEKENTLLEFSYKVDESDEPPTYGYYGSYQSNILSLETYMGIDWMKEVISKLTAEHFTFSSNVWIGVPGNPKQDLIDTYFPLNTNLLPEYNNDPVGLSVFVKTRFDNDVDFHGPTNFHNDANFAGLIHGVAYRAQWGDIGEYYSTDADYESGTLLQFGGSEEMTIAKSDVNGIVSTKPGYVLNSDECCENKHNALVAICGKVPVKVIGKINKFDKITLSEIPGIGHAKHQSDEKTIAIALESSDDSNIKKVLCSTRLSLD